MTKLTIRGEDNDNEQKLEFYLTEGYGGRIELRVSDASDPEGWYILSITPDGKILMHGSMSNLGGFFKIDDDTYVEVEYE